MISIKNLHKSFGKNHVLKGLDLGFDKPGTTAILGPNGSGKTTIIKAVLGMVIPDEGSIEMYGKSVIGQWQYREHIAYLPQIARFPENLTVGELINMVKDLRGQAAKAPQDEALLTQFDLQPFLDKRLGNLSGGTRQKVNIVLAFLYDCPLIILDEPTAGLDPLSLVNLKELIENQRAMGKTILITTHVMGLVEELADEVVYLLEGRIHFRGTPAALKEMEHETSVERAIASLLRKQKNQVSFSANGHSTLKVTLSHT
ncbi:MAG: ABC transporter ATP-binding protein [Bacteroidetes bacterium]|nr:ABC transporter ATP-binding protein [Bacteroidota bacterium]